MKFTQKSSTGLPATKHQLKEYVIDPKRLHCSPGSSILRGRQISSGGTLVSPFTEILRRCSKLRRDTSGSQLALRPGEKKAHPEKSRDITDCLSLARGRKTVLSETKILEK